MGAHVRKPRPYYQQKKEDPPPNRFKPIPVQVINHITVFVQHSQNLNTKAIADMIIIAVDAVCPASAQI